MKGGCGLPADSIVRVRDWLLLQSRATIDTDSIWEVATVLQLSALLCWVTIQIGVCCSSMHGWNIVRG